MAHKIIIDTDIGEDIDDILVAAFALVGILFQPGHEGDRDMILQRLFRRLLVPRGNDN